MGKNIKKLFLFDLCEEQRDTGFSPVGTSAGDYAFGDRVVIAGDQNGGGNGGLLRLRSELGQFLTEAFELRENGQIFRTFFSITTNTFCSGTNIGHFDDSFR